MHRLLKRQLKKFLKVEPEGVPPDLQRFIEDVNEAYEEADRERSDASRVQDLNALEIKRFQEREAEMALMRSKLVMLDSFTRFVPRQFLQYLGRADITAVELGDAEKKHMTILFTDIRNFTTLSEEMTVDQNFRFLNSFLSRMGPIVQEQGGFIDKFIGDAIMALFPPGGAENAVKAAISMRRQLAVYNQHRARLGYVPIDIGIGLNSGEVMLGTVGSLSRLDTTVIGDPVNLASRIESLTKRVGASILVSEYLLQDLQDPGAFRLRLVGRVKVAGKQAPVALYEIFDADDERVIERKLGYQGIFGSALEHYQAADFHRAIDLFADCNRQCPADLVAERYVLRCQDMIENPPGPDWGGVTVMPKR